MFAKRTASKQSKHSPYVDVQSCEDMRPTLLHGAARTDVEKLRVRSC